MQLVSIASIHASHWKAHAADEHLFPLCNSKKQGVPIIPGTMKLECNKCRDILLRRMAPKVEKPKSDNPF